MRARPIIAVTAMAFAVLVSTGSSADVIGPTSQTAAGTVQTEILAFKDLYTRGPWQFTGVWKNGNAKFVGTATGSASQQLDSGQPVLYPFSIQSVSGHGSLSGTCSGFFTDGQIAQAFLTCTVSISDAAPVTVRLALRMAADESSTDTFGGRSVDYYGEFTPV